MSAKLKLFLILILSIFATVSTGVYITQHQASTPIVGTSDEQTQHLGAMNQSQEIVEDSERYDYQTIPLETLNSALQGSDPATLALNAFDEIASGRTTRKVEVVYPQRNQALVTITQIDRRDRSASATKYRVEMTTFGRSLLVSSPPIWQIVWAGSQVRCLAGSRSHTRLNQNCQ